MTIGNLLAYRPGLPTYYQLVRHVNGELYAQAKTQTVMRSRTKLLENLAVYSAHNTDYNLVVRNTD